MEMGSHLSPLKPVAFQRTQSHSPHSPVPLTALPFPVMAPQLQLSLSDWRQ